jgi:uncharacterized protein with NRDE domain
MQAALEEGEPSARLFEMLSNTSVPPDLQLPHTGVGPEWERRLSSALITGADYGTRASTVLAMGAEGATIFEERTRDASGAVTQVTRERFTLKEPVSS